MPDDLIDLDFKKMPKTKKSRKTASNQVYNVEKITGKRIINGGVEYYIKWKGYPMSERTWEREEDCNCAALIREFEASLGKLKLPGAHVQPEVLVPKKKVTVSDSESKPAKSGFDRNFEPETIIGATKDDGKLTFLIKWKGCDVIDRVHAEEANFRCPQVVIKFYESKLT